MAYTLGKVARGGIGTVGGIVYPLVYSSTLLGNVHVGYSIVALSMLPIVLLNAWVYRPHVARRANVAGLFGSGASETANLGDD